MHFVFCSNPISPGEVDDAFRDEFVAARATGADCLLIDFDALGGHESRGRILQRLTRFDPSELAIYRGWMLNPLQYLRLHEALFARGLVLINSPSQYRHCHYFPESFPDIQAHAPRAAWIETRTAPSGDELRTLLKPFGASPILLKDYVKSRKHEWFEACFIPSAADEAAVKRVVDRFFELQGEDLNGGLVFREFVELEPAGAHPVSGMPLSREFRLFFLDARLIACSPGWDVDDFAVEAPPFASFRETARSVASRFFSMDIAQCREGRWIIIELGDGQVTGLPSGIDRSAFYAELATVRL